MRPLADGKKNLGATPHKSAWGPQPAKGGDPRSTHRTHPTVPHLDVVVVRGLPLFAERAETLREVSHRCVAGKGCARQMAKLFRARVVKRRGAPAGCGTQRPIERRVIDLSAQHREIAGRQVRERRTRQPLGQSVEYRVVGGRDCATQPDLRGSAATRCARH